jgi:hypothetical protein
VGGKKIRVDAQKKTPPRMRLARIKLKLFMTSTLALRQVASPNRLKWI